MDLRQNLLSEKRNYLFGSVMLIFISLICVGFSMLGSDDFDLARQEVLLRKIGHELLLQSGDSTSRVLPVKKIAENEYQISFENELSFQPDTLVNTIQSLLAEGPFARDYVVNVVNPANASVVFGYAISKNKKDDIIACRGRRQPIGCYMVNIKFKPSGIITAKNEYFLGGLLFLGLVGFIFLRYVQPRKTSPDSRNKDLLTLGPMSFDAETRKLMINGKTIDLTRTETRVLHIFALSPNEAIERSRLQKEIWEDEGVIVGRSLDMFISKLRKKLEFDPNINIVVIRGKGYKLEISS
ncbi:winged helix-turn-helix domain-containing protein [Algoriphagus sp. D3-2-R+10]|uniref:winged helix-turn-helix domain-containing protein n=1 Tax=Algoriphagus aurantiacus TaxID=3103948 RepID=UPI002B3CB782|nr:winged helix-turn-helix domain-containing protein [Algoriphagus sp. D3-2-R+10]MEB2774315.1 winged helix-turn-helix domain-containing protein [Algoriphagus sp. D3-2-R+10]